MFGDWTLTNKNGSPLKKRPSKNDDEDSQSEIGSDIHIVEHGDLLDEPKGSKDSGSETESVKSVKSVVSSSTESVKQACEKAKVFIKGTAEKAKTEGTAAIEKAIVHYSTAKAKTSEKMQIASVKANQAAIYAKDTANYVVAEAKTRSNKLTKEQKQKGSFAVALLAIMLYMIHRELTIHIMSGEIDQSVKKTVLLKDQVKRAKHQIPSLENPYVKSAVRKIKEQNARSQSSTFSWVQMLKNKSSISDFSRKMEQSYSKIDLTNFRSAFKTPVKKTNLPTMHLNNYSWSVASSLSARPVSKVEHKKSVMSFQKVEHKKSIMNWAALNFTSRSAARHAMSTISMKQIKQKGFKKFEEAAAKYSNKNLVSGMNGSFLGKPVSKAYSDKAFAKTPKVTASNYYKFANKSNYSASVKKSFDKVSYKNYVPKVSAAPKYSMYKGYSMKDLKTTETQKKINNLMNLQHFYTPKKVPVTPANSAKRSILPEYLSLNSLKSKAFEFKPTKYMSRWSSKKSDLFSFSLNGEKMPYVNSNNKGKYMVDDIPLKAMPTRNIQKAKDFASKFDRNNTDKVRKYSQQKYYSEDRKVFEKKYSSKFEKYSKYSAKKHADKFTSPKYNILEELKMIEMKSKFNLNHNIAHKAPKIKELPTRNLEKAKSYAQTFDLKKSNSTRYGPHKFLAQTVKRNYNSIRKNSFDSKAFAKALNKYNKTSSMKKMSRYAKFEKREQERVSFNLENYVTLSHQIRKTPIAFAKQMPTRNLRKAKAFNNMFDLKLKNKTYTPVTSTVRKFSNKLSVVDLTPIKSEMSKVSAFSGKSMHTLPPFKVIPSRVSRIASRPAAFKALPTRASRLTAKTSIQDFTKTFGDVQFPLKAMPTRQPLNKKGYYTAAKNFVDVDYSVADEMKKITASLQKRNTLKKRSFDTTSLFSSLNKFDNSAKITPSAKKYNFNAMSSYLNKNFNLFPKNITVNKSWFPKIENPGVFTSQNFGNYKSGMFSAPIRSVKNEQMFNFESHPLFADFKPNMGQSVREFKKFGDSLPLITVENKPTAKKVTYEQSAIPDFGMKKMLSKSAQKLGEYLREAFGGSLEKQREAKRFALMKLKSNDKPSFESLSKKLDSLKQSMAAMPRSHILSKKFDFIKHPKTNYSDDEMNYSKFKKGSVFSNLKANKALGPKTLDLSSLKTKKFDSSLFSSKANNTLADLFARLIKKSKHSAVQQRVQESAKNTTESFSIKLAALKAKASAASKKISDLLKSVDTTPKNVTDTKSLRASEFFNFGNSTLMKSLNVATAVGPKNKVFGPDNKVEAKKTSVADILKNAFAELEKKNSFENVKVSPRVSKPYKIVYDSTEAKGVYNKWNLHKTEKKESSTEKLWNPPRFWKNRRQALWDDL